MTLTLSPFLSINFLSFYDSFLMITMKQREIILEFKLVFRRFGKLDMDG